MKGDNRMFSRRSSWRSGRASTRSWVLYITTENKTKLQVSVLSLVLFIV